MSRTIPGVVEFARSLYPTHPELEHPVRWPDFLRMAERSRVAARIVPLSRPARLIRYGNSLCIRINRELNYHLRTLYGVHELCHVWRDEFGQACVYADEETVAVDSREDFADLFAWYVTSEARVFQLPLADRPVSAGAWQVKLKKLEAFGYGDAALAIATSQAECRIAEWKRGRGKPDVVTARLLDRILSAEYRSSCNARSRLPERMRDSSGIAVQVDSASSHRFAPADLAQ